MRETLSRRGFFAANTTVGWVDGFYEKRPTTNFWLLHAAFAAGPGLCFLLFKFIAGHHLERETGLSLRNA